MTKADLVEQVAHAVGRRVLKRECELVVDAFLDAVREALARGGGIELRGFGTFKVRHRKARTARNPRTGETVEVAAYDVPVFRLSKLLRSRVDQGSGVSVAGEPRGAMRTVPHGAEPAQRRLRPRPLQRTPVPFGFPSEASPDGNTKVVFKIVAEGSPPVAARPKRWPPRARSWLSSSAGPGRVTPRTAQALPGREGGSTPAEGRAESVPEAGGTGADAAAMPTTPPPVTTQTNAKSTASPGGDRWSAGEHPATGRMDARPGGGRANQPRPLPQRRRSARGVRGGTAPRQPPQGTHGVWPHGVCGPPETRITAGDHVSSIRTA